MHRYGWEPMASAPKPPRTGATSSGRELEGGDLHAWAVEYGPALRRFFSRRASAADVDDLVQDVFLKLQVRGATSDIDNIEGYLFRTAASVLSQRRRYPTWAWGSQEDLDHAPDLTDDLSPERILIGKQTLDTMMKALRDLPPRCAQAFILYRFEHLPQEAVARRMGISVKAVEALLQRTLRRLFEQVGWRP